MIQNDELKGMWKEQVVQFGLFRRDHCAAREGKGSGS